MASAEIYHERLARANEKIRAACERAGRDFRSVRVIGVTKYVNESQVDPLVDAGIREFGENRWQQAEAKLASTRAGEVTWHFIGHLQRNKARLIVPHFSWIHSLDSLELAEEVSRRAEACSRTIKCLLQVNISGEKSKFGLEPRAAASVAADILRLPGIELCGLMTMAPHFEDANQTRPMFRELCQLLRELRTSLCDNRLQELSMGMSNDYPIAVEEGATMVRLGRTLME